jgi:hypothetical protein
MRSGSFNREQIINEILPKTLAYISKQGGKRAIRWCNWLRIYRTKHLRDNGIEFDRRFRRSQDLQLTYEATICAQNYYYLGDEYLYHNRVVPSSLSRGYTKNMWSLYKILIERLYEVTEKYEELNLIDQMHLRAFFFVTDCIENELKPLCPNDMGTRIRLIEEIMDDSICERFIGEIPVEKLNSLYQEYYKLICKKDAKGIFKATKKYERKEKFKKKYWKPFVHFVTESKLTGRVYRRIRHQK